MKIIPRRPKRSKTSYRGQATVEVIFDISRLWTSKQLDSEETQAEFVRKIEWAIGSINVGERLGGLGCGDFCEGDGYPSGEDFTPESVHANNLKSVRVLESKVTSEYTR